MIDETVAEIRELRTHSSSEVAVNAARALSALFDREFATVEEYERSVERNVNALRGANPSHASLQTSQREILDRVQTANVETVDAAKAETEAAIEDVIDRVQTSKRKAAANARALLSDGTTILTHDYSTTVLEAIETAASEGDHLTVYVTEARPRYLGRRTARTLAAIDRVDVHLCVDSAAGHYLPECDRVLVGMDCIVDGTLYNRVGTFTIAATAAEVGVPMTVVGSSAKIVKDRLHFEIDHRPESEVMREPAVGFTVENPAYDATPIELLDGIVTDDGPYGL